VVGKFGIDIVRNFFSILDEENVKHAVIVFYKDKNTSVSKTPDALTTLQCKKSEGYEIEHFDSLELKYNILDHAIFFQHQICSKDEIVELKKIGPIDKIPYIKKSDMGVRVLFAQTGNIIKIIRKKSDGSTYPYYRKVVA
jgi:DNA-directed RNA polymerase subunit H (RpoH/RPB5)